MWPLVILALLLAYAYHRSRQPVSQFSQLPGRSFINAAVISADGGAVKGGQPPGHIKYLGKFVDGAACENACAGNEWCRAYTWHHPADGSAWSNQCFGLKSIDYDVANASADSGLAGVELPAEATGDIAAANGASASVSSADVAAATAEHLTITEAGERVRRGWLMARERASSAAVNARFRVSEFADGARNKFNNTMGRRFGGQSAGKEEPFSIQHPNRNDHCVGAFDCMYSHDGAAGQLSSGHFHEQLQAAWENNAAPIYSAPGQAIGNLARQTNWAYAQHPTVLL